MIDELHHQRMKNEECRYFGMICRGILGGGVSLVENTVHLGGLRPPKKSCIGLTF